MAPIVFLCFFLSGASGLVLELVWTRELTLVFGSTTLAMSTVLSVFMGGLALGSWRAARVADKVRDPLRAYALMEAGVGLYALALPLVLVYYPALSAALWRAVGDHPVALSLLRFLATGLLLLVPTTLMGATLPLLARHLVRRPNDFGRIGTRIGSLYAINTLGAVAGTALAGFWLLPTVGVRASNACAAVTNLTLAAAILFAGWLDRRRKERELRTLEALDGSLTPYPDEPARDPPISAGVRRLALAAFLLSGAAAMVYQVLWTRALAIVIGSSIYSFTLILLAFLVGLAGGAALWSRLSASSRRPLLWLSATHVGVVVAVFLSLLLIDRLPAAFLALLRPSAGRHDRLVSVDDILTYQFFLAALPVLPATLFLGGIMPLTVRVASAGIDRVGKDVGEAYSVNTLGAIVGSFAAGFVVLPMVGLDRGLRAAAVVSALLAAALLWVSEVRPTTRRLLALVSLGGAVAGALLLPRWDLTHFQAGLFRVSLAKEIVESGRWAVPELLYYHDGIATTVSVERWGKHIALKNNGKVDASNGDDMPTQIMVGLMPLLFHHNALVKPPRVAVIGYGSGVTIGAVTQFPIAHADVVELEPEIVTAGRYFDEVNHQPDQNPKVKIHIGDGRNFLAQSRGPDDRYDVIISEPSNPWITGVSNLFTRDYWRLAQARLADDGVFCQWAQLYEMSPVNIKIILRTFSEVFPFTYVFSAEDLSSDLILIAANHPIDLDRAQLARNFDHPVLAKELARGDVKSVEDLFAYLLLTPEELPAFTAGAPTNTDDNALIEFAAPRDLLGYLRYDSYLARVYGSDWPYGRFEPYLTGLGEGALRGDQEARIAESLLRHGKRHAAERFIRKAKLHGGTGAEASAIARTVELLGIRNTDEPELPLASEADPLDPPTVPKGIEGEALAAWAREHTTLESEYDHHRWAHALKAMEKWPERYLDEGGKDLQLLIGFLLYKAELEDDAVDRLKPLAEDAAYVKRRPVVLYYLARALYGEALYQAGTREMRRYVELTTVGAK